MAPINIAPEGEGTKSVYSFKRRNEMRYRATVYYQCFNCLLMVVYLTLKAENMPCILEYVQK